MSLKENFFTDPFKFDESLYSPGDKEVIEKQVPTTRKELWGYYLYYNGDNGLPIFSYITNLMLYLPYNAGFDPTSPTPNTPCNQNDNTKPCNVYFGSGSVPVTSLSLYIQAIGFVIQFLLFTTFGALADYGRWNVRILFIATIIACATQIIPMAFQDASSWPAMMAITIIASISYGTTLVFYAAAFPTLTYNLPIVRAARASNMPEEEVALVTEKWLNHVSTISTTWSNIGLLLVTGSLTAIAQAPYGESIIGNYPIFNNIGTAFCGAFWVANAIWYFIWIPKERVGPPLPKETNVLTVGWISLFRAVREARRLKYAFLYIIAYFMFSDGVSTINSLLGTTLLNLVTGIASILGCVVLLWFQKLVGLSTKWALMIILGATALIPLWGTFGIGFTTWGIHTKTELWLVFFWSGFATAPVYAWQQTMLAELTPKGKAGLFFGLFGVANKASSWIGPLVIGAITNVTNNVWDGWPFVLALFVIPMIMIFFIDENQARIDIAEYDRIEADAEAAAAQGTYSPETYSPEKAISEKL
ncbi:autophagy-related protein 22-like protein [Jimgerdemannia flammicorona]|uniref:Autophagy-related protein n=1 Tax=Jimgerdemannia flammicorona TaxID=994334 RepID=A0A433Q5V2_9FUNG|nr:autophagy-related protein 22-like protein [Jimgerdemannia flammicorona]